jgi:hypothetical protein
MEIVLSPVAVIFGYFDIQRSRYYLGVNPGIAAVSPVVIFRIKVSVAVINGEHRIGESCGINQQRSPGGDSQDIPVRII